MAGRRPRVPGWTLAASGYAPERLSFTSQRRIRTEYSRKPKLTALAAIPHRVAVALAYYDGLTYRQVAEKLGIPEGTAKSRLRATLRGIAARLEKLSITS